MHHVLSPWGSQDDLQRANVELTGRKCFWGAGFEKGEDIVRQESPFIWKAHRCHWHGLESETRVFKTVHFLCWSVSRVLPWK